MTSDEKMLAVLRSVAVDFICFIDVELATGYERQFFVKPDSGLTSWSDAADYATNIAAYARKIVSDEDRERFLRATELTKLTALLCEQREFVIDYDAILDGRRRRFRGHFVLAEEGTHIHIGIRDITETHLLEHRSHEEAENARYERLLLSESADRRTVLIIACDADTRGVLRGALAERYRVLETSNGEEGLRLIQKHYASVSIVLLDLTDGYDVLRTLNRDSLLREIPVAVIASAEAPEEEERCLKMGASDFLRKPVNPNVLLIRVSTIIRLRESSSTLAAVEFDTLTGLRTRQAFFHHAELLMRHNPDRRYSLILSDIEDFRLLNLTYGEETGNRVLIAHADMLKGLEDHGAVIGRYGDDSFIGLVESTPMLAQKLASERALAAIEKAMPVPGVVVKYGLYEDVDTALPILALAERAAMALQTVKHRYGESVGFYTQALQDRANREHRIEAGMREAYDKGQFLVYYQPKHDAATGKLIGAEALIRWNHPELGFLSPGEFIPLFERNGFIALADYYMLCRVCDSLCRWHSMGLPAVPVSVNSSRVDFERPDYVDRVLDALRERDLPAELLHIEVTESAFARSGEQLTEKLTLLRERGIRIELDDFGSGYSSLNTLATLPLDIIKLDMALISRIKDPRKARVLSSCVTLAKTLGYRTIAEGVETEEQLELLRSLGCDAVQGYYYARPLPEEDFELYMAAHLNRIPHCDTHRKEAVGSGLYVIDREYNVVTFNKVIERLYPAMRAGEKCHKCLMGLDEPCGICPVKNGVRGPHTYLDPIRNVYERVNVVDIPLEGGGMGHALVLYTIEDQEE